MTDLEKYWMLMEDLKVITSESEVALIHYFEDTGMELKKLMDKSSLHYKENELVLDANNKITLWSFKNALKQSFSPDTEVICAEVFPTKSATIALLDAQKDASEITFYSSMDSPFFELFGSSRIKEIMVRMGVKQNEKIQHQMIDKSIERAQEKLEKHATNPDIFTSFEDWIAANPKN